MRSAEVDRLILRVARTQHGVFARWQFTDVAPASFLDDRVKRRRLLRHWRGVYAVPGLEGSRADVVAAVLAAGPHAVGSNETAGHVHELVARKPARVIVSTPLGHPARRTGIVYRRVLLQPDECTVCDGVPVTSPARTILDLAATLPNRALEQVVARGLRVNGVTRDTLLELLARYQRRPGTPRLRALLTADSSPSMTRSEAEERFLALVRAAGLPEPGVNTRLHGYEVDFYWPSESVVVEIDGLAYHTTRDAQQRDRRRDTALAAAGIRVLRFTWHDLTRLPFATVANVALALGRGIA